MKRLITVVIASAVFMGLFVYSAEAQRSRRSRAAAPASSAALAGDMAGVQWGWSQRQLMDHFRLRVRESYAPRLAKAPGAIEEDRLRHQMQSELRVIRDSYFEFNGQASGHDAGFLRTEFTHNNNESMLRVRTETSEDYYFFIGGHLWKWYRAFHAQAFAGADFGDFSAALEGRYGRARRVSGVLHEGGAQTDWIEWQDRSTRARAIDNTQFFGFYCVVFEERATLARLDTLRTNRPAARETRHALVDSVTSDAEVEVHDPHADVADRITGRNTTTRSTGNQGSKNR